jgi:hypothetical protein
MFKWSELIWLIAIAVLGLQLLPVCLGRLRSTWCSMSLCDRMLNCTITVALFCMWMAYVITFIVFLTHRKGV